MEHLSLCSINLYACIITSLFHHNPCYKIQKQQTLSRNQRSMKNSSMMHNNTIILSFIILSVIWSVNGAALKTLSTSCMCDTTDGCDYQCCCDAQCPKQLTTLLTSYNYCLDDNFGIPFCSTMNLTDIHPDDLYSGLKTIYTVIKRLFCVSRVNVGDPTFYYREGRLSSDATIADAISKIDSTTSSATFMPANVASLQQKTINGLFYTSDIGICQQTNAIPSSLPSGCQQCRAKLQTLNSITSDPFLSIQSYTANFPSIRILDMSIPTSSSVSSITANTTTASFQNVVTFVKLFINPSNNIVNQVLSYIVVSKLEAPVSAPCYLNIRYQYVYLNPDASFVNSSNIGYQIGSPLQLLKKNSQNNYFKVFNPLNLAYRTSDGSCRSSTTINFDADQSIVDFRLGKNVKYTCIGDQSVIYNNVKNSFDYVGIMGSSNTALVDYVPITWPSAASTLDASNILIKFLYTKIGASSNPQYYILSARAQLPTNTLKQKTLFIQYQQVSNTASTYIPPPPTVDAYLPNDFLYPFYVAA